MINAVQIPCSRAYARRLIRHHYFQIGSRPYRPDLVGCLAITFRPGGRQNSFHGRMIQRAGQGVLIALRYEEHSDRPDRLRMPLLGFRAQTLADGTVHFGGEAGACLSLDASLVPRLNASGQVLNPVRNPTLVETALRLDQTCLRRIETQSLIRTMPILPRFLLGFAPDAPPDFEDTPALRQIAARELRIPVERLGSNGPVLLERLLHDIWERQLIRADAPGNTTGNLLLDAEVCHHPRGMLQVFEDFTNLVGLPVWNPARSVDPLRLDNPARDVLRRFDVDAGQDFSQYLPDQLVQQLEQAMREAVGPIQVQLTQEEILDGLTAPEAPLISYTARLAKLRAKLTRTVSECCTDDDILKAARSPNQPLLASGACGIQVIRQVSDANAESLRFSEAALGRRCQLDLNVASWTPRTVPGNVAVLA